MIEKSTEYADGMMGVPNLSKLDNHADKQLHADLSRAYVAGFRAALTSLLEELPEPTEMQCSTKVAQIAYREKIKSLIQNKLK